jgi:hypothetical protein
MSRKPQFPAWALVLLLLGLCIGGVFAVQGAGKSSGTPTCAGEAMQPGDTCDVYVNGILDHTDTYEDRVQQAQNAPQGALVGGGVAAVCLIILIAMVVSYRRKVATYEAAQRAQAQAALYQQQYPGQQYPGQQYPGQRPW